MLQCCMTLDAAYLTRAVWIRFCPSTQTDLWRVQNQQFSSSEISILGLVLAVQVRQYSAILHVTTEVLYLDYVDHRKVDCPCDIRMQLF